MEIELNFDAKPEICVNCKKQKGRHKSVTLNCPIGRGNFQQYKPDQFFKSKDENGKL